MNTINLWLLCALLSNIILPAQVLSPVKTHYKLSKKIIEKGDEVTLIFALVIDKPWHVYSNIQNYELGPMPATFVFYPHPSYELVGNVTPMKHKKQYDPVFEVDVNYFESLGEFRQKIKIFSGNPVVKGFYEYQICNTRDGMCIMKKEDFEYKI